MTKFHGRAPFVIPKYENTPSDYLLRRGSGPAMKIGGNTR